MVPIFGGGFWWGPLGRGPFFLVWWGHWGGVILYRGSRGTASCSVEYFPK
jgi:hypothetical protein